MSVKIFDPTAPPASRPVALAPRPAALAGLRVGLVENTKFNADTLLLKLAARLGREHGITVGHMARKRSPSHEVDEATIAKLAAGCHFVISGIGD
ncbi:MAG TPA: hypothetical protein VGT40_10510 [Methylomirabilota bacterium]|jgi:hypothetical protein|nr:hypothetical protein [Methylomirabilota bacterium]